MDLVAPVLMEDPDHAAANVEMARALHVLGDLEGAEEHYRRALRQTLDYPLVVELAGVVGAAGHVAEAEELLDAALDMARADPRLDPGEAKLVRAVLAASEGRTADAARTLDELEAGPAGSAARDFARRLRERIRGT